jgi:membrane dipeptidase
MCTRIRALAPWCVLAVLAAVGRASLAAETDPALAHAQRLLHKVILFDGHNDLPWAIRTHAAAPGDLAAYDLRRHTPGQTDLERLRVGGVGAQFWSVYVPGEAAGAARTQLEQIDLTRRLIARYPEALRLAGTAAEIRAAHRAGRIGSMLGIEGGHAIENSLGALRTYYELGVRYMTLTHNTHTDWADSAAQEPPRWHGLNAFGEEVVREMNRLGMLVDLSHTSPETMDDALRVSRAPVIFSHSAARALCDVPRNVPDDILRRLPENGGVLMITFVAGFIDENVAKMMGPAIAEFNARARDPALTDADRQRLSTEIVGKLVVPRTSIAKVADHIEYVRKVAGVEHVGIGGDFDGNDLWPEGLSDVSGYPQLFAELIRRGWSDRELGLLAGGNVLRALERAEKVAAELQKTTPASMARP